MPKRPGRGVVAIDQGATTGGWMSDRAHQTGTDRARPQSAGAREQERLLALLEADQGGRLTIAGPPDAAYDLTS